MAKPSVTLRNTKGAALTYSELDTNFTNLKDATLTLTAGSGGTSVTADLNGTITIVAGTNITVSGDNSAKTITINASSGGSLNTNTVLVGDNVSGLVTVQNQANNIGVSFASNGGSYITFFDAGNSLLAASGQLTVSATGGISCDAGANSSFNFFSPTSSGNYINGFTFNCLYLRFPNRTTTERNAVTAANGMVIYNTTDNKLQVYANGAWVDLH